MRTRKVLCLILAMATVIGCFAGCGKDEPQEEQKKFNEGIVNYEAVAYSAADLIGEDDYGQIMNKNTEGYEVVFGADLSGSDQTFGGHVIAGGNKKTSLSGTSFCVPSSGSGVDTGDSSWVTVTDSFKGSPQYQLAAEGKIESSDSNGENGMLLGFFVNDAQAAKDSGDGIRVVINPKSADITLFSTPDSWKNGGDASISVKSSYFKAAVSLNAVVTYDNSVFFYINRDFVGKFTVKDGEIELFNSRNKSAYKGSVAEAATAGDKIVVGGVNGGVDLTKLNVAGIPASFLETKKKVTATPVGDNKLGLDITDKTDIVSICYTMWFNNILGSGDGKIGTPLNVTELLETYKFSAEKGFYNDEGKTSNKETRFHYWAEPAQGYYRSTDETACRNNMTMLYNAGVDFIICDYTYLSDSNYTAYAPGTSLWETYVGGPMETLLSTIMKMRAEGLGTPYVVMWTMNDSFMKAFKKYYYTDENYADCFVYWEEKPLILRWNAKNIADDFFTVRGMYGLQGRTWTYQWSYLEHNNANTVTEDFEMKPEHMCCCVAAQTTYMSDTMSAQGREGGKFWNEQWQNVFDTHPKIVTLTWWNEWTAQLLKVNGQYVFTDNFNQEYSRDIEPMKGGHGDQYYKWLVEYVKAYKAHEECPALYEK